MLEMTDEHFLLQIYQDTFRNEVVQSFSLFPQTQESIVAEVNHDYIVKIPRAKRGSSGIRIEKQITELLRDKSLLELPNITLYETPQLIARYPKIFDNNASPKYFIGQIDEAKIEVQYGSESASLNARNASQCTQHMSMKGHVERLKHGDESKNHAMAARNARQASLNPCLKMLAP